MATATRKDLSMRPHRLTDMYWEPLHAEGGVLSIGMSRAGTREMT
jgi:hypothetical protein